MSILSEMRFSRVESEVGYFDIIAVCEKPFPLSFTWLSPHQEHSQQRGFHSNEAQYVAVMNLKNVHNAYDSSGC